jgi:hypothetical protein
MQAPDSRQGRWVSFDEARMILRMSEGTLRRAIKDGKVVAEQRRRNPDSQTDLRMVYEVWIVVPPALALILPHLPDRTIRRTLKGRQERRA